MHSEFEMVVWFITVIFTTATYILVRLTPLSKWRAGAQKVASALSRPLSEKRLLQTCAIMVFLTVYIAILFTIMAAGFG